MASRRGSPTGLDAAQIEQLRSRLANGGRPRVRLTGSQFPPDATGTVIRVGDPSVNGDDYITVRVRIAGIVDELDFAPGELQPTGRSAGATKTPPRKAVARPRPETLSKPNTPTTSQPSSKPAKAIVPTAPPPAPSARPAKPGPRRRPAPPPPVSISITSVGSAWTVSVKRGPRGVVKNAPLVPGAVTAIAALLDQPAAQEAVAAVNDTARGAAEQRAAQLRAELAEVQAVLDSHRRR